MMPAVLIKKIPAELHRRLKKQAARNRRSMAQETLRLLEKALDASSAPKAKLPEPVKTKRALTDAWLKVAIRSGRA